MKRSHAPLVGIAMAFAVTGLVACGSSASKVVETKDGKVSVAKDGKSVTVEGENGATATFGGTNVPVHFPTEVPLPKGLKLKTSAGGNRVDQKFFTISYDLGSKSPATVADAYKRQLADAGFAVESNVSYGKGDTAVESLSATGKGYRVASTLTGSGHLLTLVVTSV